MKKALVCLLLAFTLTISTTVAVFAVDDPGILTRVKSPITIKPMVDEPGF